MDTVPSVAQNHWASPQKNLHLSNQYKILVPTKIIMRFLGVYFQSSRLVGGYFTAFSAARLVNLGPFGSGQHPTTALMLQAMQDSAVSKSFSGFRRPLKLWFSGCPD